MDIKVNRPHRYWTFSHMNTELMSVIGHKQKHQWTLQHINVMQRLYITSDGRYRCRAVQHMDSTADVRYHSKNYRTLTSPPMDVTAAGQYSTWTLPPMYVTTLKIIEH